MTMDTAQKRASMLGFRRPFVMHDLPDGDTDGPDRATLMHLYSGIPLSSAPILDYYSFRGLNLAGGSIRVLEDDGVALIDSHVNGIAFSNGRMLIDSGPIAEKHYRNAGCITNERGALYVDVSGIPHHIHGGVPFADDGRVVVTALAA